jgi:hypothetical protein
MNTSYKPNNYEQEAMDKYALLPVADQNILDAQVEKIRRHMIYHGYRSIPNNITLLGLVLQVGKFCVKNNIQSFEREK